MKTFLILVFSVLLSSTIFGQTKMKISSGSTLYIADSTCLLLENVDLINEGLLSTQNGSILLLTGSTNSLLGGSGLTNLAGLQVRKTGTAELRLNGDISISDSIAMQTGNLNLNTYTISLADTATVEGETAANRIYGTSGNIQITQILDAAGTVEPGNLGLQISSADLLGSTLIVRAHGEQTADDLPANQSILRYYEITPSLNTGLDVDLVFEYFDTELNSIPESELSMWRSDNSGTSWFELGFTDKSSDSNFLEIEKLSSLARITAASAGSLLPVELIDFRTQCTPAGIQLDWQTASEFQNDYFTIEYSSDGRDWAEITQVSAMESSHTGASYSWQSENQVKGYFRLRQTDFDGTSQLISDVVFLDCAPASIWQVFPNPMQQQGYIRLQLQEDAAVLIHLINSLGQHVQDIKNTQLAAGHHLLEWQANLPSGMYHLRARIGKQSFTMPIVMY